MIERIIGIDFGTSTSVVKVKTYKDNEPLGLRNAVEYVHFDNKDSLPTLVYKTDEGRYLVGYNAQSAAVKGRLYQNFKLNLISLDEELRSEAEAYTEIFFKHMYEAYEEQKSHFPPCDIETTYISYPAKWPRELRELMTGITEKAGFKNVKGLDEPTAAIHTVMVLEGEKLALGGQDHVDILMIDMGAGTTDLVLCRYSPFKEEQIEIMNTWPKADSTCLFGGREVDEALCEYIKGFLVECGLPNTKGFNEKYMDKCKAWKEANVSPILKEENGVVRYCGFVDSILAMLDIEKDFPEISRKSFENMLSGYISQFPKMIDDCMKDIGYNGEQLDYVILTGGHSQWYFTNEILEGTLTSFGTHKLTKIMADNKSIIKMARPQETVAIGLVYQKISVKQQEQGRPSIKVTGIINLIAGRYIKKTGVDIFADEMALKRLEEAAKRAVKELAGSDRTVIDIPYISADSNGPLHLKETITRDELTEFILRYNKKQPASEKTCSKCGRKIPLSAVFCGYCGSREIKEGGSINKPEVPVREEIVCRHCGNKILASSTFCGYCGTEVKNSPEDAQWNMIVSRDAQFVCAAATYKIIVNGIDYGNIAVGKTKVAASKTQIAEVEIACTTLLMTNNKVKMKLKLGKNTKISFKVEYGGRIISTVQGADVLEKSTY